MGETACAKGLWLEYGSEGAVASKMWLERWAGAQDVGVGGMHQAFGLKQLGFSTGHVIRGYAGRTVRDGEVAGQTER